MAHSGVVFASAKNKRKKRRRERITRFSSFGKRKMRIRNEIICIKISIEFM